MRQSQKTASESVARDETRTRSRNAISPLRQRRQGYIEMTPRDIYLWNVGGLSGQSGWALSYLNPDTSPDSKLGGPSHFGRDEPGNARLVDPASLLRRCTPNCSSYNSCILRKC